MAMSRGVHLTKRLLFLMSIYAEKDYCTFSEKKDKIETGRSISD
jgi:hypothetical protein